jgi:hypothetical protein
MGYGGEVTIRSMDSSANSNIAAELAKIILWSDFITTIFPMQIEAVLSGLGADLDYAVEYSIQAEAAR